MAKKHTLKQDTSTTWNISEANDIWVLDKSAKITVANMDAIEIASVATGSEIFINGDISVTGPAQAGIDIHAASVTVTIAKSSEIDATGVSSGIVSNVTDGDIFNHGMIKADELGIFNYGAMDIHNTGTIDAGRGIYTGDGGTLIENSGRIQGATYGILAGAQDTEIVNAATGRITGIEDGIAFIDDGDAEIINRGLIRSDENAVTDLDGELTLINRGTIAGDVLLGGGDDVFDTRGGSFIGVVAGGIGGDMYKVSGQIEILETLGQGYDTVYSAGDFALAGAVERLLLVGKKDSDGVGSGIDNEIHGNGGNNALFGRDGDDWLRGGKGNDMLTGGADEDFFAFLSGEGRDRITDFTIGEDKIGVEVKGIDDFDDLLDHLSQHGDDVWLTAGKDRLVIEDVLRANLSEQDFEIGFFVTP